MFDDTDNYHQGSYNQGVKCENVQLIGGDNPFEQFDRQKAHNCRGDHSSDQRGSSYGASNTETNAAAAMDGMPNTKE